MRFTTRLLHSKAAAKYPYGATVPPISQVSAFAYESAEKLEKVFNNKAPGYAYTRIGNPTVADFEQKMNLLEGGVGAVACSSGMAAVSMSLLNILSAGDEVIASSGLFGGTIDLFRDLAELGIKTRYVHQITVREIAPLINEKTKVVFGELISNPGLDVIDVKEVADYVHDKGVPFFVDSTTATPYLVNPIKLGADVVIHSTSKYINGGGNSISGVIIDSGNFTFDKERYHGFDTYQKFGKLAYLIKLRNGLWRNTGACLAPMNAFMNIVGMETLGLRMERICKNALALAESLSKIEGVTVNYPALAGNPYHDLAERQFGGKGGGILTIRVGSKEKAYRFLDQLTCACNATNIGDTRTLVIHPATTIYTHNTEEEREAAGVFEDTIRISVGIEDTEDIVEDFTSAAKKLS